MCRQLPPQSCCHAPSGGEEAGKEPSRATKGLFLARRRTYPPPTKEELTRNTRVNKPAKIIDADRTK